MHFRTVRHLLVASREHASVHGVLARVPRVVASDGVDRVLSGLRQHGPQSVRLRGPERELPRGARSPPDSLVQRVKAVRPQRAQHRHRGESNLLDVALSQLPHTKRAADRSSSSNQELLVDGGGSHVVASFVIRNVERLILL